jgi:hypothetical protein
VDEFGIPVPCEGRGEPILFIEQPGIRRLRREQDSAIAFRKNDNAFLAVENVEAADKLSPAIIRERLDYWTFILGPQFSDKERNGG